METAKPRFLVRRMGLRDLSQVLDIERLSFSQPWSYSAYLAELSRPRFAHYIVCCEG